MVFALSGLGIVVLRVPVLVIVVPGTVGSGLVELEIVGLGIAELSVPALESGAGPLRGATVVFAAVELGAGESVAPYIAAKAHPK